MKKLLALMSIMCFAAVGVNAAENVKLQPPATAQEIQKSKDIIRAQREAAFERRLNLTEVQKLKAKQLRQKGHEKFKNGGKNAGRKISRD